MSNRFRSLVSLVLALVLALSVCSFSAAEGYDKVVFAYATFNNIPTNDVKATLEEAINVITREKIGVEVELKPIPIFEYSETVSRQLQGNDQIDIFQTLGDFNVAVSTDKALDITDLIDSCAPEAKEIIGQDWLNACTWEGRLYGLPTMKPIALTPMVIYRRDIAEELNLDFSNVNSPADLTDILRKVKEAHPEITPVAAVNAGNIGLQLTVPDTDYLTDDYYAPKGVLMNDELNVVDFYATDAFRDVCNLARTWYLEDLVMKDAATTSSAAAELMSSGNYFCYIASYSYPEADTAASLEAQTGNMKLGAKIIGSAFLDTTAINALTWCVYSMSKVPEAALKFLNLTFSDKEIINLLIYGLEGRDYVLNEDQTVSYPEGFDSNTVPYTAQLSCGTMGNFFLMYPMAGSTYESLDWELEQNKTAKTSVAMGFTFDNSRLKSQYTAVANVITQFLPGLVCGSVDPEADIPEFIDRLTDAGLPDIINAKQEQLNAWVEANKK
jgi:putative aldouronate transport system substrate-binding protein